MRVDPAVPDTRALREAALIIARGGVVAFPTETFYGLGAAALDPQAVRRVFEICEPYLGAAPAARTAPYMTDAANLLKVYAGAPTVVLGPGEAAMAHQTDEYCHVERLRQSVEIYEKIIQDWCFAPA